MPDRQISAWYSFIQNVLERECVLLVCLWKFAVQYANKFTRQILVIKSECSRAVNQLFLYFKTAYVSVMREILYIFVEFGKVVKVVRLIKFVKMKLKIWVGKHLCDT
jgi:hypothetical protein